MHIEDAKALLKDIPIDLAIFLWGGPGVGKSSLVKQMAHEQGIGFKDVRLTTIDPTDLRGLPFIKDGTAVWANPALLPNAERDGEFGILLLDELNSAHPTIQAGAYQLVLDRQVGDYKLPPGWRIIAAGNREEDRGVTFVMPRPLSNRFIHIDIDVDKEVWMNWAMVNNISPSVIAFIEGNPGLLAPTGKNEDKTKRAFPTPRSWAMASGIIANVNREDLVIPALTGTIGEAASHQLHTFLKLRHKLPNIKKILAGSKEPLPKEASIQYAFYGAFCGAIDDAVNANGAAKLAKDDKFVDGIIYVIKELQREFVELILKYMTKRHGDLMLGIVRKNPALVTELSTMFAEFTQISQMFKGKK